MSRKSVAKYELDKAENKLKKRMNSEMQNALDDLRKKNWNYIWHCRYVYKKQSRKNNSFCRKWCN